MWTADAAAGAGAALGNYGFLSRFDASPGEIVTQVDHLMDDLNVRDVQFYDWFDNYAGKYQLFTNKVPPGKAASSSWWLRATWTDPWFSSRTVRRDTLLAAIQQVRRRGGRAWSYIQVAGSEYWNLAGQPDGNVPCGDRLDPQVGDNRPYSVDAVGKLCKLIGTGGWFRKQGSNRSFPAYFMNAALATYQVDAWLPVISDLGFNGVHWDTLGSIAVDKTAEAEGVSAFLLQAGKLLAVHGLPQTMNQIDTNWWNESLFNQGVLAFPYSEVWSPEAESLFYAKSPRGGVIANYPGSSRNGCCCAAPGNCSTTCMPRRLFTNCPYNWTQEQVLETRWQAAWDHQVRYLVVGNGFERLIDEYFPETTGLSKSSIALIQRQSFAFAPEQASKQVLRLRGNLRVLSIVFFAAAFWIMLLVVALRWDCCARAESDDACHPTDLSDANASSDRRWLLIRCTSTPPPPVMPMHSQRVAVR
jgi:hypothetical protein